MATNAVCANVVEGLESAIAKLATTEGEMVLDFSPVKRLDVGALSALEKLANEAQAKSVKVVLCDVPSNVYRVLKLMKLAPRFAFRD